MIAYNSSSWLLFPSKISKAVITKSLFFSFNYTLLAFLLCICYMKGWIQYKHSSFYKDWLSIFSYFFFMSISFRLNSSYTNWSSGIDLILKITNQFTHVVNSFYTFLHTNENKYSENNMILNQFKQHMIHYMIVLFDLQSNNIIDKRRLTLDIFYIEDNKHYLRKSESSIPETETPECLEMYLPSQKKYLIIESNIKQMILRNQQADYLNTTQASSLIQAIDVLCGYRSALLRMQHIPPVCIYIQLLDFYMYTYLFVYILSIIPQAEFYSCIWAFTWGFIVSLAIYVSKEIDTPFGIDKNDINLHIIATNTKRDIDTITFLLK